MLPPFGGTGHSFAGPEDGALHRLLRELRADLPVEPGPAHVSRRSRFAEVLSALGQLALSGDQIEKVLATACGLVAETLSVDGVVLLEPTASADRLLVRAGAGCLSGTLGEEVPCGPGTQAGFALTRLDSTATADVQSTWPRDAFLARHGLTASALALLPGPSGLLGLVGAYETGVRAFEPDEIRFIEAAAACLSAAMERHRSSLERERLYARLAMADRMVSLGALTGGVVHEINNPLSYVLSNLTFIAEEVAAMGQRLETTAARDTGLRDSAQQIAAATADAREGVEKLRGLVRDLQTLAGSPDAALVPLDLTHVLEASVSVARSELKQRARIQLQLAASLPPVRANEARLGQVFLNLLVNAAHAIPEGKIGEHLIAVRTFTKGDEQVVVEVSDTGCGIPAEQLERIFDPFFSTKAPSTGTGLGLSISRSIVVALGGELQVESQVGRGSTFRLLLPVAPAEAVDPRRQAPPARGADRRARILVVDDEPLVGIVIERTLGDEYDVVPLSCAREALALLTGGEKFDLIFSDLLMPGLTGMELFGEVERLDPVLASRMVFLTGGAFTPATREFLARPGVEYISKPFDLQTIRSMVATRLRLT